MEKQTNDITALRDILFEELRGLDKGAKPEDLERARTKSAIAQTILNSAKVEIDYMRQANTTQGSGFIPVADQLPPGTTKTPTGLVHKGAWG